MAQKKYAPIPAGATVLSLALALIGLGIAGTMQRVSAVPDAAYVAFGVIIALALAVAGVVQRNLIGYVVLMWRDNAGKEPRLLHHRVFLRWSKSLADQETAAYGCVILRLPLGGLFRGEARVIFGSHDVGRALCHSYAPDPTDERRIWVRGGRESWRMFFEDYASSLERLNILRREYPLSPGEMLDRLVRYADELVGEIRRRRDLAAEVERLQRERLDLLGELSDLRARLEGQAYANPTTEVAPPAPRVYSPKDVDVVAPPSKAAETAKAVGDVVAAGASLVVDGAKEIVGGAARRLSELPEQLRELTLEDLTDAKGKVEDGS